MSNCVTTGCSRQAMFEDLWCIQHYGVFEHTCEHSDCTEIVIYDDEPYCFRHSPDSGSHQPGYSARMRT